MGIAPRQPNIPMAVCNGPQRTDDVSLSPQRLFLTTTAALPAINTVLAAMTRTLIDSAESARLGLAVDQQQYFVHRRGSASIVCITPILGLSGSQNADRNWGTLRAIGVKFNDDINPSTGRRYESPTKAELLWQASFRTSALAVGSDHICIPAGTPPTHATNLYFCDLTFLDEDNAATENVLDYTRGESVRVRGAIDDGCLSIESDGADYDVIVFTGRVELPTNEAGAAANSIGGVITEI